MSDREEQRSEKVANLPRAFPTMFPTKSLFELFHRFFAGIRLSGNPARTKASEHRRRSRLKLGVKGSQVQILSARQSIVFLAAQFSGYEIDSLLTLTVESSA